MADTAEELARILSLVLGVPVSPEDELVFRDIPAWDSMKHIEIIMAVEEKFGVSFAPETIPVLVSQAILLKSIHELREQNK